MVCFAYANTADALVLRCFRDSFYSNTVGERSAETGRKRGRTVNVLVIYKAHVSDRALDDLARELPSIISKVLEVPGGKLAIVRPEDVSLEFCLASPRDVGADIRIMVFARSNDPRTSSENSLAREILDNIVALLALVGGTCSVDVRLYLLDVGMANYVPTQRSG